MSVLYISYDGILEPIGRSQVLSYLERLSTDHQIFLITFEKECDWAETKKRGELESRVKESGIRWISLRYHKRPSALATAFDIFQGTLVGIWLSLRHQIQIVHARSYVSSVMALVLKWLFGLKYVFDMRGFWADERVDGCLWPKDGWLYHMAKGLERRFLLAADRVVSLTQAAVEEMRCFPYLQARMPKFEVITTCTDLNLFSPRKTEAPLEMENRAFTVGYVGSVGVWYLFGETLQCFKILQQKVPSARLHIFNRGNHAYIMECLARCEIPLESVRLEVSDHQGVACAMRQMDVGIFFIKPVYSKISSAPTKLGEFLGCGVPCLGNAGVGDMSSILEGEQVGVVVRDFSEKSMRDAVAKLLDLSRHPEIKNRCRDVALKYFSLDDGVRAYNRIYCELQGND